MFYGIAAFSLANLGSPAVEASYNQHRTRLPIMNNPPPTLGLCHVALKVCDLEACEQFYVNLLRYQVEWRPDKDNLYLCSGSDNLALHRDPEAATRETRLDHLGIVLRTPEDVDIWHQYLNAHGVPIKIGPRTHRDGARSFYCLDPEGNTVQMIYHPPLSDQHKS